MRANADRGKPEELRRERPSEAAQEPAPAGNGSSLDTRSILGLQSTVGNAAVSRLLRPKPAPKPAISRLPSVGEVDGAESTGEGVTQGTVEAAENAGDNLPDAPPPPPAAGGAAPGAPGAGAGDGAAAGGAAAPDAASAGGGAAQGPATGGGAAEGPAGAAADGGAAGGGPVPGAAPAGGGAAEGPAGGGADGGAAGGGAPGGAGAFDVLGAGQAAPGEVMAGLPGAMGGAAGGLFDVAAGVVGGAVGTGAGLAGRAAGVLGGMLGDAAAGGGGLPGLGPPGGRRPRRAGAGATRPRPGPRPPRGPGGPGGALPGRPGGGDAHQELQKIEEHASADGKVTPGESERLEGARERVGALGSELGELKEQDAAADKGDAEGDISSRLESAVEGIGGTIATKRRPDAPKLSRTPNAALQRSAALEPLLGEKQCTCGGKGGPNCTCGGSGHAKAEEAPAPDPGPSMALVGQTAEAAPEPTEETDGVLQRAPADEKVCTCGAKGGPGCTCGGHGHADAPAATEAPVAADVAPSSSLLQQAAKTETDGAAADIAGLQGLDPAGVTSGALSGLDLGGADLDLGPGSKGGGGLISRFPSLSDIGGAISSAAGSVVSAVVPDDVKAFFQGAPAQAQGGIAEAQTEGQNQQQQAQTQLEQTAAPAQSEAQSHAASAEGEAQAEHQQTQQAGQQAQQEGQQMQQQAAQGAQHVAASGDALGPMLNPAQVIAHPEAIAHAGSAVSQASQQAAPGSGQGAVGQELENDVRQGLGADGKPGWNCDEAEVVSVAGNVGRTIINRALNVVESVTGVRAETIRNLASRLGNGINKVVGKIKGVFSKIGTGISKAYTRLRDKIMGPINRTIAKVQARFNQIKQRFQQGLDRVKQGFVNTWNSVKNGVTNAVNGAISKLRGTVGGIVQRVQDFQRNHPTIWAALGALAAPALGIVRAFQGAVSLVGKAVDGIRNIAGRIKDKVLGWAKNIGDRIARGVARVYQGAKDLIKRAKDFVRRQRERIINAIPEWIKRPIRKVAEWAKRQAQRLRDAADHVRDKVLGKVCAAINPVAEACANQYLPDLGQGTTNSVKLTASGDVTVPLEEFDIPANLKIGGGSSVEISRTGSDARDPKKDGKTFVVKIVGESLLMLNEEQLNQKPIEVNVDLPSGNKARVWQQLTGGGGSNTGTPTAGGGNGTGPAPATGGGTAPAATGGGAPAATGGAGVGTGAGAGGGGWKVEGGVKGKTETTYAFSVGGTNCDGLGGMVTLLGALGLSHALPAPFDSAAGAATQAVFRKNMRSNLFTVSGLVTGAFDLGSRAGFDKLKAQLTGQVDETVGIRDGKEVHTLTIQGSASGSGELKIDTGKVLTGFGGKGSVTGTVQVVMEFVPGEDTIKTVSAKGELAASVQMSNFDPTWFQALPGAGEQISRALMPFRNQEQLTLKPKASVEIQNIQELGIRLDAYLSRPIEQITMAGVLQTVQESWEAMTKKISASLTAVETQRIGVGVSGGVSEEGVTLAGNASVGAEHTIERVIWEWSSSSGGSTPTPVTPVVPPPITTPVPTHPDPLHPDPRRDDPNRGGGGRGGGGSGGKKPTLDEVLNMSPSEFGANTEAQDVLFNGASDFRDRMNFFAGQMIERSGQKGEARSILKRNDKAEFVRLILEKCARKGYSKIGQMPDIVRGRFNMDTWDGVQGVVNMIRQNRDYQIIEVVDPRRPQGDQGGFGYPRFHVVIRDKTSQLQHEWQVGTLATTKVFETEGIPMPDGVTLPADKRSDIHDIEYDVFGHIEKHDPKFADEMKIPWFRRQVVDPFAAESGRRGSEMIGPDKQLNPEAAKKLSHIHQQAGDILKHIAKVKGPEYINRLLRGEQPEEDESEPRR